MMTRYGICPVCGSHISEERHDNGWVLCECGWLGSKNAEKYESDTQRTAMTWIFSVSIFILIGFVHSAKWGNDSISVIPYQVKNLIGVADQNTTLAFAELSIQHKQITKGESLMSKWAEKENTADAWEKLALLRSQMKEYNSAVLAFDKYYEAQGTNPLTMFHYAQVLEELDRPDLAKKIYVHIVGLDKDTYQRTVVEELVRLLVNQQKLKEAQSVLAQLSKPNMELPSHLVRQKEWIEQLLNDKSSTKQASDKNSASI
jgi:tetratricopeptide (TPR) repeat protein